MAVKPCRDQPSGVCRRGHVGDLDVRGDLCHTPAVKLRSSGNALEGNRATFLESPRARLEAQEGHGFPSQSAHSESSGFWRKPSERVGVRVGSRFAWVGACVECKTPRATLRRAIRRASQRKTASLVTTKSTVALLAARRRRWPTQPDLISSRFRRNLTEATCAARGTSRRFAGKRRHTRTEWEQNQHRLDCEQSWGVHGEMLCGHGGPTAGRATIEPLFCGLFVNSSTPLRAGTVRACRSQAGCSAAGTHGRFVRPFADGGRPFCGAERWGLCAVVCAIG
jgi:hypothetical protein